jgi:hypothetical protein
MDLCHKKICTTSIPSHEKSKERMSLSETVLVLKASGAKVISIPPPSGTNGKNINK